MPKGPRILSVDDRAESLLVRRLLLEQFGCEVTAVTDVISAREALSLKEFDVALIDYHLNESVDGEQIAREIRSSHPAMGLIMLTGDPKIPDSAKECVDIVLIKGQSNPSDLFDAIEQLAPGKPLRPRRPSFNSGAS